MSKSSRNASQRWKYGYFWLIRPAENKRFCWNQNALLKKYSFGNRGEITISWMVKPVTGIALRPPRIAAKCCSLVSGGRAAPVRTPYPSRDRDIVGGIFSTACGIA
jgi:hypothetical protein